MKIRIKVKHAIYLLLGLLFAIPFSFYIIKPQIELLIVNKHYDNGEITQGDKADIISLLNGTILFNQKWDLTRKFIVNDSSLGDFDVFAGPSHSMIQTNGIHFTPEERIPYLKRYIADGPADGFLPNAAIQLAGYYQQQGKEEAGTKVLQQAQAKADTVSSIDLQMKLIMFYLNQEKTDKAKQTLEKVVKRLDPADYDQQAMTAQLKAEILVQEGRMDKAYETVKKALADFTAKRKKETADYPDMDEGTPVVYEQLTLLKNQLDRTDSTRGPTLHTVSGRLVRSDGTPVKHAAVFLREEQTVSTSVHEDEKYQQLTDENGKFSFQHVIPGSYQLFLGFTFEQIDGWTWPVDRNDWIEVNGKKDITRTITLHPLISITSPVNQQKVTGTAVSFAWDKVDGAAYYNLDLGMDMDGGTMSIPLLTHIQTNQIQVPIEDLYNQTAGMVFEDEDPADIDPKQLLGFSNPANRFSWSVSAYNAQNELITQSNGYRLHKETIGNLPFFYLPDRKLSRADQLLLDNKPQKALDRYQKTYQNKPSDLHSLQMINRLIRLQTEHASDEQIVHYMTDLAQKAPIPDNVYDLADYYYEKQEWESYNKYFQTYLELENGSLDAYTQGKHATALLKQGKTKQAIEIFRQSMERDASHEFIGNYLAAVVYRNDSLEEAVQLAAKYPEHEANGYPPNWRRMADEMKQEQTNNPDYIDELHAILKLLFANKQSKVTEWLQATDKRAMKEFIIAVKNTD